MKWRRVNFIWSIPMLTVTILLLCGTLVKISLLFIFSLPEDRQEHKKEGGIDY